KTDANFVESIEATFTVRAFGASYHNAFGFQFPTVTSNHISSVTGYVLKANTIFDMASNGTELNQSKATFIVYDDAFDIMSHPGEGIGVNTTPGAPYVDPVTITINIVFEPNTVTYDDLDIGNLNPFIVMKQERGYEVHLANFEPTDLFDASLFGVYDDDSNPSTNRYFLTDRNLPWAINIPDNFSYMNEKSEISMGYLKFILWAESEGVLFPDWYMDVDDYRNDLHIY
ncbi:MAG: LruC domain-containing protein, partial [Bacteroidales bacterium]|nr:LruC domain-containing protein [Bacteroidales bacterium]